MRAFLPLASYYCQVISNFVQISLQLDGFKKCQKIEWKEIHEEAFKELKEATSLNSLLVFLPKSKRLFHLKCAEYTVYTVCVWCEGGGAASSQMMLKGIIDQFNSLLVERWEQNLNERR